MNDRHKIYLALLLLLGTIVYGVWQWNVSTALAIEAKQLQTEVNNLTTESTELATDYQSIKKDVSEARSTASQELSQVFPAGESLSDLTRLFDTFSVKNNFQGNPFFISQLNYASPKTPDGATYQYVPVSMSVSTSKKNLSKFLEYIESSGSLEGEVRLMGVENMNISYPSEYGGTYAVNFDLNAYFAGL
jgi:uncharacterized protein YoxC